MLRAAQFWTLSAFSLVVLALVIVNMLFFRSNTRLQQEINERQLYIQQSMQLEGLYRDIVKALAELSVKNNDEKLKALLSSQGITLKITGQTPATGAQGNSK